MYEEKEIQEQDEVPKTGILGKMVIEKPIHRGHMQSTLSNI